MSLAIRPAHPDDAERLVDLLVAGAAPGLPRHEDPSDLAPYRHAIAAITADPAAELLVAEVDGEVVGMCQLALSTA
jgi:hypothetical protein